MKTRHKFKQNTMAHLSLSYEGQQKKNLLNLHKNSSSFVTSDSSETFLGRLCVNFVSLYEGQSDVRVRFSKMPVSFFFSPIFLVNSFFFASNGSNIQFLWCIEWCTYRVEVCKCVYTDFFFVKYRSIWTYIYITLLSLVLCITYRKKRTYRVNKVKSNR